MAKENEELDKIEDGLVAVDSDESDVDPWDGLTTRQAQIQALRMRNVTQKSIGQLLGISQVMVHKELKKIREIHKEKGASLDREVFIGSTVTKFDLLEQKAWDIYNAAGMAKPGEKVNSAIQIQAIQIIAGLQEKRAKLYMDLGLLEKAATKVDHTFKASGTTLIDTWDTVGREKLAETIIVSQMKQLPAPEPPDEEDAEFEEE